jgi:hypothetical protein
MEFCCPGFFSEKRRRVVIELKTSMVHVIGINNESDIDSFNSATYFTQIDNITKMYANTYQHYNQRKKTDKKMIEIGNKLLNNKSSTPNEQTPLLKK